MECGVGRKRSIGGESRQRCYGVGSGRSGKTRKVVRWEEKERGVMECGGEE